jgi:hypothetical protein
MRPKLHPEPERIVSSGMLRVGEGVGVINGVAVGVGVGVGVATGSGVIGVAVGVGRSVDPSFAGNASIKTDDEVVDAPEDDEVDVVDDVEELEVVELGVGVGVPLG